MLNINCGGVLIHFEPFLLKSFFVPDPLKNKTRPTFPCQIPYTKLKFRADRKLLAPTSASAHLLLVKHLIKASIYLFNCWWLRLRQASPNAKETL